MELYIYLFELQSVEIFTKPKLDLTLSQRKVQIRLLSFDPMKNL